MKRNHHPAWQPNVYVVDPWVAKLQFGAPISVVETELQVRMEVAFIVTELLSRLMRS